MFDDFIRLVRDIYQTSAFIPLHEPRFVGNEKRYLMDVIDSTFVSSVGPYVTEFENRIADYCGARHAIATVNGTAALHIALLLAGLQPGEEVITQAVTFVATCNAIHYGGAAPIFVDVDTNTLGLSPSALSGFLSVFAERRDDGCYNRRSGKRIAACLPMHTFGHPCDMSALMAVCEHYGIPVIEDAAEALGSFNCTLPKDQVLNNVRISLPRPAGEGRGEGNNKGSYLAPDPKQTDRNQGKRHCGTFGKLGVLSFNGNKIITTGGGGMILTDDDHLAQQARHLTTTAKQAHAWRFEHDQIGYNYRMPNLNAALGLAQLEQLPRFIEYKRALAKRYLDWGAEHAIEIVAEPTASLSNYWLNAVLLENCEQRDAFLAYTNEQGIMTRPLWELMMELPMYRHCQHDGLANSRHLANRLVNIPSSVYCA